MANRVELHHSYILHTRPYRDTSLLVDVLTQGYGKITLIAKGARRPKSHQRYLLQPFIPVLLSWQGKSALKTLIGIDTDENDGHSSIHKPLRSVRLYSAMYVNELLSYVLVDDNPTDSIFAEYQILLEQLREEDVPLEHSLRCFELSLLDDLGYGINLFSDANTDKPFLLDKHYGFIEQHGFVLIEENAQTENNGDNKAINTLLFSGKALLEIQQRDFSCNNTRQQAKQLMRLVFSPLLKGRALKSRELF